jgi:serine protease Do
MGRSGQGHGSEFIVGGSGYLLTNQHVVKQAKRVQVIFANGLEVPGEVLRRDAMRNVVSVKILIRARSVLPIRKSEPNNSKKCTRPPAPSLGLAATITKGIVSAWRKDTKTGLRHIQADVSISGRNSGGPLVDGFSNVVGISIATIEHPRAQSLNLFIPIDDALESLNIQIETQRTSMNR